MAKENISAAVETTTIEKVRAQAEKQDRSFSWMVDHVLQLGLKVLEDKK